MSNPSKHLAVLGLSLGATPEQIRSAYKRLAIQWHPDKNNADEATSKFQEISCAYTALTEPDYRSDNEDGGYNFFSGREGVERYMNLFQQAFFSSSSEFVFADGPSFFLESEDECDDEYEDLAELFTLQLLEAASTSLTIDWSESAMNVASGLIYRLDICCSEKSLQWSVCYLGVHDQCKVSGLLPATQYEFRLGVVDHFSQIIDFASGASFKTKGSRGKRRIDNHPKVVATIAVPNSNNTPELLYKWNMNRVVLYEKLVIDPDIDMMPRRFDFGDGDDFGFEVLDGSETDDLGQEYVLYSDGEMSDEMWCADNDHGSNFLEQMNFGSGSPSRTDSSSQAVSRSSRLCRFFLRGACRYGNSCRFSHDPFHQQAFECEDNGSAGGNSDLDDGIPRMHKASNPKSRSMPPCRFFLAGNCRKINCRFAHDFKPSVSSSGANSRASERNFRQRPQA